MSNPNSIYQRRGSSWEAWKGIDEPNIQDGTDQTHNTDYPTVSKPLIEKAVVIVPFEEG